MNHDDHECGSVAESCWADEQHVPLDPGHEICDCGHVIESCERRRCVHCGHEGCVHCLHLADEEDGDAELNNDYVCSDECEIAWLEYLQAVNNRDHRSYQDWVGRRIEAVRNRKVTP